VSSTTSVQFSGDWKNETVPVTEKDILSFREILNVIDINSGDGIF
jgi:hypothetical protein